MIRPIETQLSDSTALEGRLAARLAAGLSEQANALPHDLAERLRVAREQAVRRAREVRVPHKAPATSVVAQGASAILAGPPTWWMRLATWFPLVVLVAGLVLIEDWTTRQQVMAAAEIDAVILADDLPPDAWTDPGFREFLKATNP